MQLKDITNVLTFRSFRPEPQDGSAAWSQRFAKQRTLLLNVNRNSVRWQLVTKSGELGEGGVEEGLLEDVLQLMGEDWRGMTDGGWVSVSLNNRFILSLESNLSRKKGYADLLRNNPKSVLGSKFERGKKYAIEHHPETNSSILLTCEEGLIKEVQELLKRNGFNVGRISCGLFAMVSEVLSRVYPPSDPDPKKKAASVYANVPPDYLLIACCEGSICVLKQKDSQWAELRSRPAYYQPGDLSTITQILEPMLAGWRSDSPVIFVSDSQDGSSHQMKQMFPGWNINDITSPSQLWHTIGNN